MKLWRRELPRWKIWLAIITCVTALITLGLYSLYDFLAVPTHRVKAEVLVVEGWIYDYCFDAAVQEYSKGNYTCIATSGLMVDRTANRGDDVSYAHAATRELVARGVPPGKIITCPAPPTKWNRTSSSAQAVREKLRHEGITLTGVNVVTVGSHARQTWLAYRRIMGPDTQAGIITVPKQGVDTAHWWKSAHGTKMVLKNLAGWLKECLVGYRE